MTKHAKTVKRLLDSYKPAFLKMMRAKEEIEKLKSQMLKSPSLSGMPQGNEVHDLSDYVANLETLIAEQHKIEQAEGEKMRKVKNAINQLIGIDNTILSYKYIDFMTFTDIAIKLELTSNAVYIRHNRALERIKL